MKTSLAAALLFLSLILSSGCRTYVPPGAKADLQAFAPPNIQAGFATQPSLPFPATIAFVRIQNAGYTNYNLRRYGGQFGSGAYTVIMTREVEEQSHFDRVTNLPMVSGLVSLNRLLVPEKLENDRQIREAASRLQADLVFIYTFDTAFFDKDASKPLSVITLGLSPTRQITASTTVSSLLMDTRTGYIYSAYETTERAETISTSWGSGDAADQVRRDTEKRAFTKMVDEIVTSWPRLLKRYEKH
ncbi:MAG: hypothetical protein QM790_11975 [Nibricoccus sp.]